VPLPTDHGVFNQRVAFDRVFHVGHLEVLAIAEDGQLGLAFIRPQLFPQQKPCMLFLTFFHTRW